MNVGSYSIEWSWNGFSAIISTCAVLIALFGEKLREHLFRPKIQIQEFGSIVPKPQTSFSDPVVYEHYVEVLHYGRPVENARFEILKMTSNLNDISRSRPFYPAALSFPMNYGSTITTRDTVKIAEVSNYFELPKFPVEMPEHPWLQVENDPHYRGRLYARIIGKSFRSEIWPIDLVKDSKVVSGWRLEVHSPESEKSFFQSHRNYIREYNESNRVQGLP